MTDNHWWKQPLNNFNQCFCYNHDTTLVIVELVELILVKLQIVATGQYYQFMNHELQMLEQVVGGNGLAIEPILQLQPKDSPSEADGWAAPIGRLIIDVWLRGQESLMPGICQLKFLLSLWALVKRQINMYIHQAIWGHWLLHVRTYTVYMLLFAWYCIQYCSMVENHVICCSVYLCVCLFACCFCYVFL